MDTATACGSQLAGDSEAASPASRLLQDLPAASRNEEFDDLVALLTDHAGRHCAETRLFARIVAHACLGENHLWQDLGLPDRQALNDLMRMHFPALHAKNAGNMRWKKFLYRQLCERAEVLICKSPSCGECCDYAACFGPEEAAPAS
jgi:nitrogen fixation protein NifQ